MMLYVGRYTYRTSSSTMTTGDYDTHYSTCCQCPNCGNIHGHQQVYDYYDIKIEVEPEPLPEPFVYPRPSTATPKLHFKLAPVRHERRAGRALQHRGSFRNFHKMKD